MEMMTIAREEEMLLFAGSVVSKMINHATIVEEVLTLKDNLKLCLQILRG